MGKATKIIGRAVGYWAQVPSDIAASMTALGGLRAYIRAVFGRG